MQYRLNRLETVPVTLYHVPETVNDKVSYTNYMRLTPDTVYETSDQAQINYLTQKTNKVRYSPELESALKEAGIEYTTEMCPSCGGRVKKIKYKLIEVVE